MAVKLIEAISEMRESEAVALTKEMLQQVRTLRGF